MKNKKGNDGINTPLLWKMAIAASIAWEIAKLIGSHHPYLAPLTVVLCMQNTIDQSIKHSFQRIAGTVIGIILTAYIASYLEMNGWSLALLILGGTLIVRWLRFDETVLHQAALTMILIFTFEQKSKDYALDRITDTIVGAVIAIFIQTLLFPPDFTKKAAVSLQQLSYQLSEIFSELSDWIQSESGQGKGKIIEYKVDFFLQELHQTKDSLHMASRSLKYNPFGKRHESILSMLQMELSKITSGYRYVSTIVETIKEWEAHGQLSSYDKLAASNDLNVLSEFFGNPLIFHQDELKKEKEKFLYGLQDLLLSKRFLNIQPGYEIYRDSFCLETKKLLKSLTVDPFAEN